MKKEKYSIIITHNSDLYLGNNGFNKLPKVESVHDYPLRFNIEDGCKLIDILNKACVRPEYGLILNEKK